jgi:hypothetical protein
VPHLGGRPSGGTGGRGGRACGNHSAPGVPPPSRQLPPQPLFGRGSAPPGRTSGGGHADHSGAYPAPAHVPGGVGGPLGGGGPPGGGGASMAGTTAGGVGGGGRAGGLDRLVLLQRGLRLKFGVDFGSVTPELVQATGRLNYRCARQRGPYSGPYLV